ncbi:hypothetical protein DMB38_14440 [Streptomyces sp. WAC 06738]|uniref:hypothetical protein n=1 Tax=Streptomyces sp. WAC 06738 TaxID=2203210 RepID=UPI000F6B769B|nr:hypothetical protein [Streptomyces sp. WAC 06738]AZM46845.1 hypothetical protein DMB38_14440 [Streptomyces sp. WAC 06738]
MTFPDGTSGPQAADDPPTTRLTPIRPDTRPPGASPYGTFGSPAQGAFGSTAQGTYGTAADAGPAPEAGGRTRRRGKRTALLLAAAVLAGALGGVTYGYFEQAGNPPTPLPPLNQPGLAHPDKPLPADEAEPLSAAQDRRVKTDGDLRELLVSRPDGTVDAEIDIGGEGAGWLAPYEVAAGTGAPEEVLTFMLENGLRRTAFTAWRNEGDTESVVMINLYQFRNDATAGSVDYLENQQLYSSLGPGGRVPAVSLKGSADGMAYFPEEPFQEAGVPPLYQGMALARRGDIVMEIYQIESSPLEQKDLKKLAERQLERL